MDFDEYDYLEKTVEDDENRNGSSKQREKKDGSAEKTGRSYRKREGDEDGDDVGDGDDARKHKRSREADDDLDGYDGKRDCEGRWRSSRDTKERDRHRSSRDRDRERREGRRERDSEKDLDRDRRKGRDGDKVLERDRKEGRKERHGDSELDEDRKEGRKERRGEKELDGDRKEGRSERDTEKELERERDRARERGSREKDREKDRGREREERVGEKEKGRDKERERDGEKERERDGEKERERDREKRDREKDIERRKERGKDESSRRSRSRSISRRHEADLDRERNFEPRESRRLREKKEAVEPEVDPERDQRTVFAYQMPLKADERDVYEFFSKAGKVRDVRLIMDRNSRRSKGVGYIEFYDAMSVPMAIALSGHLLHGQPVMVKPSEAEKNLVQSTASGGGTGGMTGPYGPVDRKLYVGNLHFNMNEIQLRQIFEPFGPVELVQLPLDLETGHCKGFGFIQYLQVEHAKAAQSLNGKLEIAGRIIKVSSVADHVGVQDNGFKNADFDDDDGGGLALNAHSRALLMQKLDRTGIASSITGAFGNPMLNGAATTQLGANMSMNGQVMGSGSAIPTQAFTNTAPEPVGIPSPCLLLKNMFDPSSEAKPDFDMDIKEEVEEECSNFGRVMHIHVDKNSAGYVYLRFESVEAALKAQRAMHMRWYACRLITALFMQPADYEAKFKGGL